MRLRDGRLGLSINGTDLLGRRLPETWGAPPFDLDVAARSLDAVVDTLVYTKAQYLTKRAPLTNSLQQDTVVQLRKAGSAATHSCA